SYKPREPILQLISPDDFICRINLRPFKYVGGDIKILSKIIESSLKPELYPSKRFIEYFDILSSFVHKIKSEHLIKGLEEFLRSYSIDNPPLIHHSEIYKKTYIPQYRVIYLSDEPAAIGDWL
ncbi:MAG: hypothetical protein ACPL6C_04420, partial [bacterium]